MQAWPLVTSFQDFENMEADSVAALSTLTGELAGNYYPLRTMDAKTMEQMIQDHFLFRNDDEWVRSKFNL